MRVRAPSPLVACEAVGYELVAVDWKENPIIPLPCQPDTSVAAPTCMLLAVMLPTVTVCVPMLVWTFVPPVYEVLLVLHLIGFHPVVFDRSMIGSLLC